MKVCTERLMQRGIFLVWLLKSASSLQFLRPFGRLTSLKSYQRDAIGSRSATGSHAALSGYAIPINDAEFPPPFEEDIKMLVHHHRLCSDSVQVYFSSNKAIVVAAQNSFPTSTSSIVKSASFPWLTSFDLEFLNDASLYVRGFVKQKLVTSVEDSTRIDSLVSSALGLSRTKIAKLIREHGVKVDQILTKSTSSTLKEGSIVQLPSMGRFIVDNVAATAKGRYKVSIRSIRFPQSPPAKSTQTKRDDNS